MDGLYRLVDYMTGVPHWTHQLPRGADACKSALLKQHNWLSRVEVPERFDGQESVELWLSRVVDKYGRYHQVEPLPVGSYTARDPLTEMQEMIGSDRVVSLVIDK